MSWYIVLTSPDIAIYAGDVAPLTREEGLQIIESDFEQGHHSHKNYTKVHLDTWQNGNDVIQLVNEQKLKKLLGRNK